MHSYRFHSVWQVQAPAERCYSALTEFGDYPKWWPEVKEVIQTGEETASVKVRAFLPYSLRFEMTKLITDEETGILRASMQGDLEGWSQWTIKPSPDGTRIEFDEDVVANKLLLRFLAPVARPIFRANHAMMMHRGCRGFQRYVGA
ncbi:MAG: SRPBCC family protein [Actinomycetota bacterium]